MERLRLMLTGYRALLFLWSAAAVDLDWLDGSDRAKALVGRRPWL